MADRKVAVVLTAWKRNYFQEQLAALRAQTVQPATYYLYQNGGHLDLDSFCNDNGIILVKSEHDFKYFGRFTVPLVIPEEFCLVLDDNVIPGNRWLETCFDRYDAYGCAVGMEGRIVRKDGTPTFAGWVDMTEMHPIPCRDGLGAFVDFILHGYFFRTEWIHHFWAKKPVSLDFGEDFHFSSALSLAGIRSYCPIQYRDRDLGNAKQYYNDEHATWTKPWANWDAWIGAMVRWAAENGVAFRAWDAAHGNE